MTDRPFYIYVIYDNPRDYPGKFVVRRQWPHDGQVIADKEALAVVDTLDQARAALPDGLIRFDRHPNDDSVIVEAWL